MPDHPVLIAGGGIGGLATALTLHQIGVPCIVFEAAREMRPLGVGINMQPNAVRELYDLGITEADMDGVGLPAREWALVGLNGNDVYSEPRGQLAGYEWPQYAVHRGQLHMLLYEKVAERIGAEAVKLGSRVTGYRRTTGGGVTALVEHAEAHAKAERRTDVEIGGGEVVAEEIGAGLECRFERVHRTVVVAPAGLHRVGCRAGALFHHHRLERRGREHQPLQEAAAARIGQ